MIATVTGRVLSVLPDSAVVEVGGVGLQVMCTPGTLAALRLGEPATLNTSLVVREDSLTLFGFADAEEKGVFELLQTASGVGPKLAQAMLAVHGPAELRRAVASGDLVALCKVPGVGRKGAQRIVLELKERLGTVPTVHSGAPSSHLAGAAPLAEWRAQVSSGLMGLGWSAREADSAIEAIAPMADELAAAGEAAPVADLLRAALRTLAKAPA